MLRLDVRLQARSRLYVIGIGLAVLLGLGGRALEGASAGRLLTAFYLLGLGSSTYVFSAALVLLERSQGTLAALRASPLTTPVYLGSKVLSLTLFAMLESVIVYAVGFADTPTHLGVLAVGLASLGILYTLLGLGQVARHDSVTAFLMPGALLLGTVVQLPVMHLLGVEPALLWYLIPTQGPMLLILAAFEPLEPWQWGYAVGMSMAAMAASAWWARRRFSRFVQLADD
jgi:fluoroquinolone transport system permease protein